MELNEKIKVVLIDDDPIWKKVIAEYFSIIGVTLFVADFHTEGLTLVRKVKPDLVILDVLLDADGIGAVSILAALKESEDTRGIMVAVISADYQRRGQIQLLELGAVAYLPKPVNINDIVQLLENIGEK